VRPIGIKLRLCRLGQESGNLKISRAIVVRQAHHERV
jgi:hypothetical protein